MLLTVARMSDLGSNDEESFNFADWTATSTELQFAPPVTPESSSVVGSAPDSSAEGPASASDFADSPRSTEIPPLLSEVPGSESTIVRLPSLLRRGSRKISDIYGVDRNHRGELIFTVLFNGSARPSLVTHLQMKEFYSVELIRFYEKHIQLGPLIHVGPYKPGTDAP
jgi:hypothetical protein